MLLDVIFVLCLPFLNISSVLSIIYILSYILFYLREECIFIICDILYDPSYLPSKEYLNICYDPKFLCNSKYTISSYKILVKFGFKLYNMVFVKIIYSSLTFNIGNNSKILCRYIIIFQRVP